LLGLFLQLKLQGLVMGYRRSHLDQFQLTRINQDESHLVDWASRLAGLLRPGMVVALEGPLGAGKTTWARAMLRSLGVTGPVKSPTYALLEPYDLGELYFYHFDFYRIESPLELEDAGFRECFDGHAICLVEWPEKAGAWLPPVDLRIQLEISGESRNITLVAQSARGRACLEQMQ
jgi:tRNA threonylcarbamoyladenosine biosynthesis protein TsaE